MEFFETDIFTRRIQEILTDEEYSLLQADLIKKPDRGTLIPGAKGLRKLRWAAQGKGKRGGARVIYYWYTEDQPIYMIYPPTQKTAAVKPRMNALDGPSEALPSRTERRRVFPASADSAEGFKVPRVLTRGAPCV